MPQNTSTSAISMNSSVHFRCLALTHCVVFLFLDLRGSTGVNDCGCYTAALVRALIRGVVYLGSSAFYPTAMQQPLKIIH